MKAGYHISQCIFTLLLLLLLATACRKDTDKDTPAIPPDTDLCIFFINDQHGNIDNFARIKHIVDAEREKWPVVLVCSGDIFSGNPVVDNYPEKGYPMIDMMNRLGFDLLAMGNHEFDYGKEVLSDRMQQSDFPWLCANVDMSGTAVPQPHAWFSMEAGGLSLTFLGIIETNGKPDAIIPSTHPFRVKDLVFERPESVVPRYQDLKDAESADLLIALTHIGYESYSGSFSDYRLAQEFPFFDAVIGGHSHDIINEEVNGVPVFQAGSRLHELGRLRLEVEGRQIVSYSCEHISLDEYASQDDELKAISDQYNAGMDTLLNEVVGYAQMEHEKYQLGCFYTDALRIQTGADISFQNPGGIRSGLDQGDITVGEIYAIDPFNNHTLLYSMSIGEIKYFLKMSEAGFYYSGVNIEKNGQDIEISTPEGIMIPDGAYMTLAINDYIPAVYDAWFPEEAEEAGYTTAEALIRYLENYNGEVNYPHCNRYFRY